MADPDLPTTRSPYSEAIVEIARQAAIFDITIDIAATIASGVTPDALKASLFNRLSGCSPAPEPGGWLQ